MAFCFKQNLLKVNVLMHTLGAYFMQYVMMVVFQRRFAAKQRRANQTMVHWI